jgi:hypothetical protein
MQLLPCTSGVVLAVHSLLHEAPLASGVPGPAFEESRYRSKDGLISQCGHCRRVRTSTELAHWEWVPELVRRSLPDTSHGLCGVCRAHYFTREEV